MKKSAMLLAAIMLCLVQFGAASAGQGDYKPVDRDEHTSTYFIRDVRSHDGTIMLEAERVEWYEGEAANEQFRLHEPDAGFDEAPDGYYIVDTGEEAVEIRLDPDAEVLMQIYNRTGKIEEADIVWNERIDTGKFASLLMADDEWDMKEFPYHITLQDDRAVKIVQQYVP